VVAGKMTIKGLTSMRRPLSQADIRSHQAGPIRHQTESTRHPLIASNRRS
jgi:hypothetical protein